MKVKEIAKAVGGRSIGDGTIEIENVVPIREAKEGDITFFYDKRYVKYLRKSRASCIVVPEGMKKPPTTVIEVKNPTLAFAKILTFFAPQRKIEKGIHNTAIIGKNVSIHKTASIQAFSCIGDDVKIEKGVCIFPYVYIGSGTTIGENSKIYPNVTVMENSKIGKRAIIHSGTVIGSDGYGYATDDGHHRKIPQIGKVIIEDDVEIGANTTIDRATLGATVIGRGTKIDNLVHIGHNVRIGENSLIIAQVGISGSVEIGKNCILAGQAGIGDHIKLGDNVIVGAQAGVTKSFPSNTKISGYPARPHFDAKRSYAAISMLPKLLHRVKNLENKYAENIK